MKNPWLWLVLTAGWLWLAGRYFVEKYAPKPAVAQVVNVPSPPDTIFLPVPGPGAQPVFWEKTGLGYRVFFLDNSTTPTVSPAAAVLLKSLAEKAAKDGKKARLTGHTDDTGSDEFNLDLGNLRARAVRKVLADNGLPEADITTASGGEQMPLAPNTSEQNRQRNRRVEIVFE